MNCSSRCKKQTNTAFREKVELLPVLKVYKDFVGNPKKHQQYKKNDRCFMLKLKTSVYEKIPLRQWEKVFIIHISQQFCIQNL